jgi:hypothetical protein
MTVDFGDRFLISSPTLAGINISQATDAQLLTASPDLAQYVSLVQSYSVLLKSKTAREIYLTATEIADPKIALILAGARDKANGVRLFPTMETVKQVMFGATDPGAAQYVNPDLNIFSEGVRQISITLTASHLIGQLAQIKEQQEHSAFLYSSALKDLERLTEVHDLQAALSASKAGDELQPHSFFFQATSPNINNDRLKVEIYVPNSAESSTWTTVGTYTGTFSTGRIIGDIADAINGLTLVSKAANIIAAPVLSQSSLHHRIDFKPRTRQLEVNFEVIMLRITLQSNPSALLPFNWGVTPDMMTGETLNSLFLATQQGKVTSTSLTSLNNAQPQPNVLYFQRAKVDGNGNPLDAFGNPIPASQWENQSFLSFRVAPTMEEDISIPIYRTVCNDPVQQAQLDSLRPSLIAEALLNTMFQMKSDTRALGALVRNDPPTARDALVGLQLVAYSATNPETWMVLDITQLPPDILLSVGDLNGPFSTPSNRPRSVRIESAFHSVLFAGTSARLGTGATKAPLFLRKNVSENMRYVREKINTIYQDLMT